jgi:hypothetical protein
MGQEQLTSSRTASASASPFPTRQCHRKGCNAAFAPRRWNQRYCREAECLRELHRWQDAKRQQRRRGQVDVRRQHAEAERQRRGRQREEAHVRQVEQSSLASSSSAPIDAPEPCAWSRSKKKPGDFCDRPGCYEPMRPSCRAPAHYCSDTCREAEHRVRDRERKYRRRKGKTAVRWPWKENGSPRGGRKQGPCNAAPDREPVTNFGRPTRVRGYRSPPAMTVPFRETHEEEVPKHDRETSAGRRPRAPPSA